MLALAELLAQLPQPALDPPGDRRARVTGDLRNLGNGQLGPVAERDGLALLWAQGVKSPSHGVAILDPLELGLAG
jgi:hypothetical protein